MQPRSSVLVPLAFGLVAAMGGCRGGCGRPPAGGQSSNDLGGALRLLPADTRIVASLDFARIRATPFWRALTSLPGEQDKDRKLLEELISRTGLDPFRHIHRAVLAFPEEARASGQMALILEGEIFDQKRLVTYLGDQARLRGRSLTQQSRGRRTLWTYPGDVPATGFFLDDRRLVIGSGGWAEQVADLADGKAGAQSAAARGELGRLLARGPSRSVVVGALIPEGTRRRLLAQSGLDAQGSVLRLVAGVDLGPSFEAELVAELSNAADATELTKRFQSFVTEAKRNPQVLLLGAGPYLDALSTRADGPNARFRASLGEAQTRELLERLKGLARLGRERLGP